MAIIFYSDVRDIGTDRASVLTPLASGDITFGAATAEAFELQTMPLEGGEVGHAVYVNVSSDYGDSIAGYTPGDITPLPAGWPGSWDLYFSGGWHIEMPATIKVLAGTPTVTIGSGFGAITQTGVRQIAPGTSGETFTTSGIETGAGGVLCLSCNAIIGSKTVHGYYIVWGFDYRYSGETVNHFFTYAGVFVSENMMTLSASDPQGGIPQEPEGGNGDPRLHGETLDIGTAADLSTDMGGGGIASASGRGTHLYEIDLSAMTDFTNMIYGSTGGDGLTFSDIWQQFKNQQHDPLSGIIGALILPITPTASDVSYIRLSGQSFAVSGTCKAITQRFYDTSDIEITINQYYNTYLDFAPYTNISLYLPFIGAVSVNTNECMGGKIQISYRVDCCTGDCVAYVVLTDRSGYKSYYNYSGNCAAYIPISSYDAGISSIISGAAGMIGGIATGNAAGIVTSSLQMIEPKTTQKHIGSFSGGAGCMGVLYPFIVINRPASAVPAGFTDRVGGISAMAGYVGDYSGYTQFEYVNLSAVSGATDAVKNEILAQLQKGVII